MYAVVLLCVVYEASSTVTIRTQCVGLVVELHLATAAVLLCLHCHVPAALPMLVSCYFALPGRSV